MAGVNKQILIGNLGKDPEVRHTQSGTAVANLRVAVGERVKKGDEWVEHTEWFNVVCFGKTAENAGQYLSKGRPVYVEGASRWKEYKKRDGSPGYSREIVCAPGGLQFLGGGGGGGGSDAPAVKPDDDRAFYDDDLPF